MIRYIIRVLIGFDTFCNSVLGGSPYETISLRSALAREEGKAWGCLLCQLLNLFQADHCERVKRHAYTFWLHTIDKYK